MKYILFKHPYEPGPICQACNRPMSYIVEPQTKSKKYTTNAKTIQWNQESVQTITRHSPDEHQRNRGTN